MPYTDSALNTAVDAIAARVDQLSLHTADPGTTGASEVTGGSPAYARKTVTWGAAASGDAAASNAPITFDVPAGATVAFVGYWDSTGPTFLGSDDVTDEAFAAQGQYELTAADLTLTSP